MTNGSISDSLRVRVREKAGDRCGYCLSPQRLVLGWLEIDHIIPTAKDGSDDEENLWLACRLCNNFKSDQTEALDPVTEKTVALFNPTRGKWSDHFAWSEDGTLILGKTPCGRATVIALQLNFWIAVLVQSQWVAAGWHPPEIDTAS
jgi:hypothetical protein